MYKFTVPLAMFGIIPVALLLVGWLRPLRGILATYVLGSLLLPNAVYVVSTLPKYDKSAAISIAALIALLAYDSARLTTLRLGWADLPMAVWCLAPSASSISNGLPPTDAVAVLSDQFFTWAVPYLFGRMYFGTLFGLYELARGVVLGAVMYMGFCLYEMRMSPVLHTYIYGFHQHQFLQSRREGGFRPTVFMQHGLAVAFFMAASAVVCLWLWRHKVLRLWQGAPIGFISAALVATAIGCKSSGAIALLLMGVAVLWGSRLTRSRLPLLVLLLIPPLYMATRASGAWNGQSLVDLARSWDQDRGDSLQCRVTSENILGAHALARPVFGWGGWGRSYTDGGTAENVIADGFWIIVLGKYGIVGLVAVTTTVLLPVLLLLLRTRAALLFSARAAPVLAFGTLLILFMIDCLFNAMLSPMWVLAIAGLTSLGTVPPPPPRRMRRPPQPARRTLGGGARLPAPASRPAIEAPALEAPAAAAPGAQDPSPPPAGGAEGTFPR